ncbi:MAG: hypothetical protein Q9191_005387 [Dirinaria sp. TL-2023a]
MAPALLSRHLSFATYDVFTSVRFKGNPLAIVKVPKDCSLEQSLKQAIAREFNFSETVFLHEADSDSPSGRRIDIFTTTSELPFAGHPTIGSVCCIAADAGKPSRSFTVLTKAGPIEAEYNDGNAWATARIPHDVHIHQQRFARSRLTSLDLPSTSSPQDDMLKFWPRDSSGDYPEFPLVSIVKGMSFILVEFPNVEEYLQKLQLGRQMTYANTVILDQDWTPSFIAPYFYVILQESDAQSITIRSRMIAPAPIGEDPGTGSAAATLGAYLALQRGKPAQSFKFCIEQGVEMGRTCQIGVEVTLDRSGKSIEKLLLSGTAVQVTEGTLML